MRNVVRTTIPKTELAVFGILRAGTVWRVVRRTVEEDPEEPDYTVTVTLEEHTCEEHECDRRERDDD